MAVPVFWIIFFNDFQMFLDGHMVSVLYQGSFQKPRLFACFARRLNRCLLLNQTQPIHKPEMCLRRLKETWLWWRRQSKWMPPWWQKSRRIYQKRRLERKTHQRSMGQKKRHPWSWVSLDWTQHDTKFLHFKFIGFVQKNIWDFCVWGNCFWF